MFQEELENLINKHSIENESNTPDFILAQYLKNCLQAYNVAVTNRDKWYGVNHISNSNVTEPKANQ